MTTEYENIVVGEEAVVGAFVTRGPHWNYGNQDDKAEYGIITKLVNQDAKYFRPSDFGVKVSWNPEKSDIYRNKRFYDLCYYPLFLRALDRWAKTTVVVTPDTPKSHSFKSFAATYEFPTLVQLYCSNFTKEEIFDQMCELIKKNIAETSTT